MYKDLHTIIKKCTELDISTWINTNGMLIDENMAKNLVDSGLKTYIFSIDGPDTLIHDEIRGRGSFEQAVRGLDNVIKYKHLGLEISVNIVLSKNAVDNIEKFIPFLKKYSYLDGFTIGLPDITGNAVSALDLFSTDNEKFLEKVSVFYDLCIKNKIDEKVLIGVPPLLEWFLKKNVNKKFHCQEQQYCMGGSKVYFIDADGIVYPCNLPEGICYFDQSNDHQKLLQECNIKTGQFSDIYTRKEYLDFFQYVRKRDLSRRKRFCQTICGKCPFGSRGICGIA